MAEADRRPLIGVTGPSRGGGRAWFMARWGIVAAGGRAMRLTPTRRRDPGQLDGIVIGGGDDIDPVLYAAPQEINTRYDRARDAFESAMIDDALERGLPLLGICRGAQLLNVRLGGTLFQDLRERRRLTSNRRTIFPLKTLQVVEDSLLHRLFGVTRTRINSLHSQSIDRLGEGLRIVGTDLDGIVQAVEGASERLVLGVQWHPEYMPYSSRQRRLFKALVDAARFEIPSAAADGQDH